jgi:2-polyprenyl-3-methyl-5-hydroxy-6-metoxy-1,4-benzoquinol methylase
MSRDRYAFDKQADFWNSVIYPDNITQGDLGPEEFNLEENINFYRTPIQNYAYRLMGNIQRKNILELGCGMGVNAMIMAQRGANVTAIDIAQKRVNWVNDLARRYGFNNLKAICMPVEDLDFPAESFDVIYSNEVLIHVNRTRALSRCAKVLRAEGKAIFIESLKFHPLVNLYRHTFGPQIFKHIARHLTLKEIESFRSFFSEVHHKEFYFLSFLAFFWQFGIRNQHIFRWSISTLNKIDNRLFMYLPFTRILAWMSCIECLKRNDTQF